MKYKSRQKKRIHKIQATCAAQQTILSPIATICQKQSKTFRMAFRLQPITAEHCLYLRSYII